MKNLTFDLQLFAIPGVVVEDDNPLDPDEGENLRGLVVDDELEEEEEEAEPEETDEDEGVITEAVKPKEVKKPKEEEDASGLEVDTPATKPQEKLFTQAEVDRILGERLARDRKAQLVSELEQEAGLDLEKIVAYVRQNRITNTAEQMGITEDEARQIVEAQEEKQRLKTELEEVKQKQELIARNYAYNQEKAKQLNNPLVKKYEAEIDAFSKFGTLVDFNTAKRYVLGAKIDEGEIINDIKTAAEQKTLADINKRSKTTPVSTGQATKGGAVSLSPEQKKFARILGVSDKEYAEEIVKIEKQKRRRSG